MLRWMCVIGACLMGTTLVRTQFGDSSGARCEFVVGSCNIPPTAWFHHRLGALHVHGMAPWHSVEGNCDGDATGRWRRLIASVKSASRD